MIAEHVAPLLAALKASPVGASRVFDGPVTANTVPPYVVAYISVTTPEASSLEEVFDRVETTAIVHSVGGNGDAVRKVAGWAFVALLGLRPTVAGRDCGRVRLIDSRPPDVNEETGQIVLSQVDVYQYFSVPG